MFGKTPIKMFLAVVAVAALVATSAHGATLLTFQSHQDEFEMQGQTQPARDSEAEIWVGDDVIVRDDGQSRVILTAEKLYLVNHEAKAYNVLDLPVDLAELLPEEMMGQYEQMKEMATMSAEVSPTDETKEVGDWSAQRYDVTLTNKMGFTMDQVIWASADVGVDAGLYNDLTEALARLQPGGGEWVDALDSIEGFPVLRETTMTLGPDTAVKTQETLLSVEEKDAPEGIFAPPADYEEQPFNPGGGGPAPAAAQ